MPVTIKDIAREAGVSIGTVSRVINSKYLHKIHPDTQSRVRTVIEKYRFEPAASAVALQKSGLKAVGLMFPGRPFAEYSNYFDDMMRGVLSAAEENAYNIMLIPFTPGKKDLFKKIMRNKTVQGALLIWTVIDDPVISEMSEENIPFVVLGNSSDSGSYPSVDTDNVSGARAAVNYLISKGHKRIGMIKGSSDSKNALDRFSGYKSALAENNIPLDESLVFNGYFLEEAGRLAAEAFMKLDKLPTAVFSAGDIMAIGALKAFREKGIKVPEDIAIIGFDNSPVCGLTTPTLTTVSQPIFEMGKKAFQMLTAILEKNQTERSIILPTKLIQRNSA
jgi:DNA-binding LacI/PurR family transcriptional regulator